MTTHAGFLTTSNELYQLAELSSDVADGIDQWRLPFAIGAVSTSGVAAKTDTQPVAETPRTHAGHVASSFSMDWYNRIHVTPGILNLGNILSAQTRPVEVWNAYFVSETLNSVTASGADGLTLDQPTPAPTVFGPLESRIYDLGVQLGGPITTDAFFHFLFSAQDAVLEVTGTRTVIFAFKPNWENDVVDRFNWMTNIIKAFDGTEQRVQLRDIPRRSLEFDVLAYGNEYQYLDSLLAGWQSRVFAVPFWPDRTRLSSPIVAGTSVLTLDTRYRDYHIGGIVIVGRDAIHNEAGEIADMTDSTVTLKKPIEGNWGTDCFLVPARLGRLPQSVSVSRPTAKVSSVRLSFDIQDITGLDPLLEDTTYLGFEVLLRKPNRASEVSVDYQRLMDLIDYGTGVVEVNDQAQRPFNARSYEYLLKTRQQIYEYKRWLHERCGQLAPFWSVTWECNIDIVENVASSDTTIYVRRQNFSLLTNNLGGRTQIALRHRDGTWHFKTVLGFTEGSTEENEQMAIDSPFGFSSVPSDWKIISFMELVVLGSDAVEIAYKTDSVATVATATRGIS